MPSAKRRTNSNSGSSAKSSKTATSTRSETSSATSPASFAQVFGSGYTQAPEVLRTKRLLEAAKERQRRFLEMEVPTQRLLRKRHLQTLSRVRTHIEDLESYLANLTVD